MKQITFAPRNHLLTNTNTWTPDSQWLVFDVRPSGASFTGETIERVNIHTGEVEVTVAPMFDGVSDHPRPGKS